MRKLKDFLIITLIFLMFFVFAACGSSKKDDKDKDQDKNDTSLVDKSDDDKSNEDENKQNEDDSKTENNTDVQKETVEEKIAKYVTEYGDELAAAYEKAFATSSGMTCTSSVEAQGKGLVIKININEFDNLPEATKKTFQKTYDNMMDQFNASLELEQKKFPGLEYFKLYVCEKDGDVIAVINVDGSEKNDSGTTNVPQTPEEKVAQYVADNEEMICDSLNKGFEQVGLACTMTIKAEGKGIVIRINLDLFDNLDDETKKLVQDTYDNDKTKYVQLLTNIQKSLPELEYIKLCMCEKDGDEIAVIDIK